MESNGVIYRIVTVHHQIINYPFENFTQEINGNAHTIFKLCLKLNYYCFVYEPILIIQTPTFGNTYVYIL